MAKTAAQLLTKIRQRLGEQPDANGVYPQTVWTDQFLLDGINNANSLIEQEGLDVWWQVAKDTSLTTVAGTNKYTLPAGVEEILTLWVGAVSAGTNYTQADYNGFEDIVGGTAYTIQTEGATKYLYLFPVPTTAQTVTIKYLAHQTELTTADTTAVTTLPDKYHMFFVWKAIAEARYREEEQKLGDVANIEAERVFDNLKTYEPNPKFTRGRHYTEVLR